MLMSNSQNLFISLTLHSVQLILTQVNSFKSVYKLVSAKLKNRRLELELTQEDVVMRTDLTRTSLANIEAGRQNPPLHVIYQLCEVLDMEPKDILPYKNELVQTKTLTLSLNQELELPPLAAQVLEAMLREPENG